MVIPSRAAGFVLSLSLLAPLATAPAHAGTFDLPPIDRIVHYQPKLPLQVLTADGHDFTIHVTEDRVDFTVCDCPWLRLLDKSDRRHLAAQVAQAICLTEGRVWCAEFGDIYKFEMPAMACQGDVRCGMSFRVREPVSEDQ